jgi:hypothetical protein
MYFILHCFTCHPSDSTVPEDAGMQDCCNLAVRHPNHSARSHTVEEVRERMAVFFYHYKKNVVGRKMLLY